MTLSAYHTETNLLRVIPIIDVKTESPTVRTLSFRDRLCARAKPGQFLMLWVPGVDEIPLSILGDKNGGIVRVAVREVGNATQAIHEKKIGDLIGIRGPFGNSFSRSKGRVLIVAGGTGTVPMLFLAKSILGSARITFVLGAKTERELIFLGEINRHLARDELSLITSTEDGTCGIMGMCTEPVEWLLSKEKPDMVYACGPEQMLLKIFELCEKHEAKLEVSLERMMRCAIGLCGSCVIGKYRVCTDGPVFRKKQLQETKAEFGLFKRGLDGRKSCI